MESRSVFDRKTCPSKSLIAEPWTLYKDCGSQIVVVNKVWWWHAYKVYVVWSRQIWVYHGTKVIDGNYRSSHSSRQLVMDFQFNCLKKWSRIKLQYNLVPSACMRPLFLTQIFYRWHILCTIEAPTLNPVVWYWGHVTSQKGYRLFRP